MKASSCNALLALLLPTLADAQNASTSARPFSLSGNYQDSAAMLGFERQGAAGDTWRARAWLAATSELTLSARCSDQDRAPSRIIPDATTTWVVGANYNVSGGSLLVGYGRHAPEGNAATRQFSIGYAYPLSRRIYLFGDIADKKSALRVRHLELGLHAAF